VLQLKTKQIMLRPTKQPLKCDECGDIATPEDMKADKIRMHQTKHDKQILCECCYEEYLDKYYPQEEYV
jgi:hypothetical protein